MQAREAHRDSYKGVFVIDRRYARGYDLKLAVDSLVYVLDNGGDLSLAEVQQCCGRSSRSQ